MKFFKKNRYFWVQIGIVLFLMVAILLVSASTFSNGIIEEEPFLSEDPKSNQYYLNVLDSENASFACMIGGGYDTCVRENFPNAKINMVTNWDDMVNRLNFGKETAVIMEASSKNATLDYMPTLYFFDDVIASAEYCYFTAKSESGTQICSEMNEFIANRIENGSQKRLQEKWMNSSEDNYKMEDVKFAPNAKQLNIAIEPDWMPLSFVLDSQSGPIGYYIDQLNLFCAEYGYTPNYISLTSMDACTMGVDSGKYDIGAMGLVYNDEIAEIFNVTEPVYKDDIYVCVRASAVIGVDLIEYVEKTTYWKHVEDSLYKNLIEYDRWQMLLQGLGNTIIMSLGAILSGTVLGALIYFLRRQNNIILSSVARLYVNIFLRMPQVLLLLILCYIVFTGEKVSGLTVCIITFGLSFSPFVAEMLRSGVDAIPEGQWRAAYALGFTKSQTFFKVIFPQVLQIIMPVYKGNVVTLVLETSIAGYIAVEDLTKMSDYIRAATFEPMTPMLVTSLFYFLLTLLIGLLLGRVEKRINTQSSRRLPKWALQIKEKELCNSAN